MSDSVASVEQRQVESLLAEAPQEDGAAPVLHLHPRVRDRAAVEQRGSRRRPKHERGRLELVIRTLLPEALPAEGVERSASHTNLEVRCRVASIGDAR